MEIATPRADRIGISAGHEVVEGLLLHGLGLGRHDFAIDERVQAAAAVLAHATDSDPARAEDAAVGTCDAANTPRSERIVERFAQKSLANIRLEFVSGAQISYSETFRWFLPRK